MSTTDTPTDDEVEDIADLPPSAKLVYKVLEYHGPLTKQELVEETRLAERTTRYAIDRLDEIGALATEPNFDDLRQTLYRADDPD